MTLAIADGRTVTLHYRVTLEDGSTADDTFDRDPFVFRQGAGMVVPGLEKALEGREAGEEFELELTAADGYGELDPASEKKMSLEELPPGIDLQVGMSFDVQTAIGPIPVWVRTVADDHVVLSANHPLAGESLRFEIRVVDVQETTAESARGPDT